MKNFILLLLLIISANALQAQQENQYTQFMYNKLLINPGYAGARGIPTGTIIYRNQWKGFEGAPKSVLASFNTPLFSKRIGVGLTLAQQKIGIEQDFSATASYSYKLVTSEALTVQAGISGSLRSLVLNFDKAKAISSGDPSLNQQKTSDFYGNFGVGVYAVLHNRFYAGLSVPNLYANTIGFNENPLVPTALQSRHFYGMFGAALPLTEDVKLMPALLLKYVKNVPVSADINVNIDIREKIRTGVSYRAGGNGPGDSIDFLLYWQITPGAGVGAAYDFTISGLRSYASGSMEILAQFDLVSGGKKAKVEHSFKL